ncbi:MAG: type II toxin-antitoxin system HipA family toxin [Solirubrobacterales bacterium]
MNVELDVYCYGGLAGRLAAAESGEPRFTYAPEWVDSNGPPLSQSLPTGGTFDPAAVAAYFDGLLPEGQIREIVARTLHVSSANTAGLLAELGWDCAGAVSVYPAGEQPIVDGDGSDVVWLTDDQIATLVDELPRRPMLADDDGELRISLAGVQDKLPVVADDSGRVGLGHGDRTRNRRTPSTHILKAPIARLPDSVANEAFCLGLAGTLGLDAAAGEPRRVAGREFLLVRRYDRGGAGRPGTTRLHQEDFCQALAVPSSRKYEAEGGPGLSDLFGALRHASAVPALDVLRLLDAVAFNLLIANHDAHAKNFSILYQRTGEASLASLYDLVSTFVYRRIDSLLTAKLAMAIGGEYRAERLMRRHFDRFFEDCQLNAAPARRRIVELASRMPAAASALAEEFSASGWGGPTIDGIVELVHRRCDRIGIELGG